jgi:hypothetical protein
VAPAARAWASPIEWKRRTLCSGVRILPLVQFEPVLHLTCPARRPCKRKAPNSVKPPPDTPAQDFSESRARFERHHRSDVACTIKTPISPDGPYCRAADLGRGPMGVDRMRINMQLPPPFEPSDCRRRTTIGRVPRVRDSASGTEVHPARRPWFRARQISEYPRQNSCLAAHSTVACIVPESPAS